MISQEVFDAVPVGSDNALSARAIWKKANIWAESTFANKLNALVDMGKVKRRKASVNGAPISEKQYQYIYWREASV